MIKLDFIPLNKYDRVIEHSDGRITIPKHTKKRYLFVSNIVGDFVYFFNNLTGSIFKYNLTNKGLIQINIDNRECFIDFIGISIYENQIVSYNAKQSQLLFFNAENFQVVRTIGIVESINNFWLEYPYLWAYNKETSQLSKYKLANDGGILLEEKFQVKGIGNASVAIINNEIFITDSEENLIRKYSKNGKLLYEAITPFIDPIGQLFYNNEHYILYGGLVNEVGYENRCWQEQKPFLHKIKISVEENENTITTFTNTFEVEFYYEEQLFKKMLKENIPSSVLLALPENTNHQKVLEISPLGIDFCIENVNNKKYARYELNGKSIQSIGYSSLLHLRSVKTIIKDCDKFYFSKNDLLTEKEKTELDCYNPFFQKFILPNNISEIKKIIQLRNIIYERLEYKKNTHAIDFVEVFEDGYGTCGDYASLMLIFFHLNNISCISASGYKIPRFYINTSGIISIYFNHTWIEVFDENDNVYAIESSSDDKVYNKRFSEGQFLGLDWTHIKLYNGKAFPNLSRITSNPNIHPYDLFKKANVFVVITREV